MQNLHLIRQQHNRHAHKINQLSFLFTEIASRMADRLDYIKLSPSRILDVGSGLSIDAKLLEERFPQASVMQLDSAAKLLKLNKLDKHKANSTFVCADACALPLASQSINLLWSNLCLPYITDYAGYFKEIRRVLAIGGCFLVSGFAPDTFKQLRSIGLNTYNFPDMHTIGDILANLGFSNPVTDVERITLEYDNWRDLLADVRLVGCGATCDARHVLSLRTSEYNKLADKFDSLIYDGKLPLTLEVFYAHAWKDKVQLDLLDNQSIIHFDR